MPMYDMVLVKKVYKCMVIEAEDQAAARDLAWDAIDANTFDDPSDVDWDVYSDGEVQNA